MNTVVSYEGGIAGKCSIKSVTVGQTRIMMSRNSVVG